MIFQYICYGNIFAKKLNIRSLPFLDKELTAIPGNKTAAVEHGFILLKVKAANPGEPRWYFNGKLLPITNNQTTPSKHFNYATMQDYGELYGSGKHNFLVLFIYPGPAEAGRLGRLHPPHF